jgi:hypothetical protein
MKEPIFSDNYIVRIYRHNSRKAHQFIGTVEEVGKEEKQAFATIDELWNILSRKKQGLKRLDKKPEEPKTK